MGTYDVCVIGAGLSGLACARRLRERHPGCSLLVLEARDRVGGRTLSVPYCGDALDLGGQWVGPAQHRTLALLHELGLQTVKQTWFEDASPGPASASSPSPDPKPGSYGYGSEPSAGAETAPGCTASTVPLMLNSGSSLPLSGTEQRELSVLSARLEAWAARVAAPSAWSRPDAAAWDRLSVADWLDASAACPAVRRELELLVRTVTASEPGRLSFLHFLSFLGMAGGLTAVGDGDGGAQSFRVAGGAQQLALGLAEDLRGRGVEVRLGAAVARVEWRSDSGSSGGGGVVLTLTRPAPSPTCSAAQPGGASAVSEVSATEAESDAAEDGVQIQASKLVLAISPPLWASLDWSPPLPADKAAVAAGMYMGSAVKTIAVYRTRFWGPGTASTANPHDGAVSAMAGAGAATSEHQQRLEELGPVANLFPSTVAGSPALIGLVTAASAGALALLSEPERRSAVLEQYERYFGTTAARLECVDFISKDWIHDRYSRGCFAALMPPGLASCGGASARNPMGISGNAGCGVVFCWDGACERVGWVL